MKKFAPKMTDGMGNKMSVSPEAHKEWADAEGKHSVVSMSHVADGDTPKKHVGADGFEPMKGPKQASIKKHEGAIRAKGMEQGDHSGKSSAKAAGGFHKTGPMTRAGKGASGVIKSMANANKKGVGGAGH